LSPCSLSDRPSKISLYIKELEEMFPNFNWKTTLHSNIIKGRKANDVTTSIRVIYFQHNGLFDVSLSTVNVDEMCMGETLPAAFEMLVTKLKGKRSELSKAIKILSPKRDKKTTKEKK